MRYCDVWFVLSVYLYKDVSLASEEYIYIYVCFSKLLWTCFLSLCCASIRDISPT